MGQGKHEIPFVNGAAWVDDGSKMRAAAQDNNDRNTIGELSREFGVTQRALRFYESKALLAPRRNAQSRIYSVQDRARLALILQGRRLGFTLGEIQEFINVNEVQQENGSLNLSMQKCIEQISLLERQKREIEAALIELRRIYLSLYAGAAGEDIQAK